MLVNTHPIKTQVFPHLPQDVHDLGALVEGRHPGVIVHQVVLALADMEQVGGAGGSSRWTPKVSRAPGSSSLL